MPRAASGRVRRFQPAAVKARKVAGALLRTLGHGGGGEVRALQLGVDGVQRGAVCHRARRSVPRGVVARQISHYGSAQDRHIRAVQEQQDQTERGRCCGGCRGLAGKEGAIVEEDAVVHGSRDEEKPAANQEGRCKAPFVTGQSDGEEHKERTGDGRGEGAAVKAEGHKAQGRGAGEQAGNEKRSDQDGFGGTRTARCAAQQSS